MRRHPPAEPGRQGETTEDDAFEIDDLAAIEHPELNGEPRRGGKSLEMREGRVAQLVALVARPTELEDPHADPIRVAVVTFQTG